MNNYYMLTEVQESPSLSYLSDGRPDAISTLFTNHSSSAVLDSYDTFDIIIQNSPQSGVS